MTYGKSMRALEAYEDDRRERIWLNDLEAAIKSHNKSRFTRTCEAGIDKSIYLSMLPFRFLDKRRSRTVEKSWLLIYFLQSKWICIVNMQSM